MSKILSYMDWNKMNENLLTTVPTARNIYSAIDELFKIAKKEGKIKTIRIDQYTGDKYIVLPNGDAVRIPFNWKISQAHDLEFDNIKTKFDELKNIFTDLRTIHNGIEYNYKLQYFKKISPNTIRFKYNKIEVGKAESINVSDIQQLKEYADLFNLPGLKMTSTPKQLEKGTLDFLIVYKDFNFYLKAQMTLKSGYVRFYDSDARTVNFFKLDPTNIEDIKNGLIKIREYFEKKLKKNDKVYNKIRLKDAFTELGIEDLI